jgi:hypothetical protein
VPTPTDVPSATPTLTSTPAPVQPYPGAPLCAAHDNSTFHTLWNAADGCHYDHEHGQNPFTAAVAAAFPGFDLQALLGGVQIGHTNPSSPAENTVKHGGFKWQVSTAAAHGCDVGFESGTVAVDAYAIQYHAFGPQSVELEARNHSAAALLRQCQPGNPSDKGYIYVTTLQEYGERCLPYQGQTLLYPNDFLPRYNCAFGPYFTTEGVPLVRPSLAYYQQANANSLTVWSSKPTGTGARPPTPRVFRLLFRGRDAYQVLDTTSLVYPFHWLWLCSGDGGLTYRALGCRYNNSSITIHEIAGDIPAAWDGLAGWDSDPRSGRVTAAGYLNQNGDPTAVCQAPGTTCYVIRLEGAFVGRYSSDLCPVKCSNPGPGDTPERDILFCGQVMCAETAPGAVPSGWLGQGN